MAACHKYSIGDVRVQNLYYHMILFQLAISGCFATVILYYKLLAMLYHYQLCRLFNKLWVHACM